MHDRRIDGSSAGLDVRWGRLDGCPIGASGGEEREVRLALAAQDGEVDLDAADPAGLGEHARLRLEDLGGEHTAACAHGGIELDPLEVAVQLLDGVERDLQLLLADMPDVCGEGFRLVRREWPTDIGPVDLMCRDEEDGWIAVEIKRVATIDAVEQLHRYLERIQLDPAMGACRGVLAAQVFKPQARVLAAARGIRCVEVDLAVLRGEREPDLTLFAA